MVAVAGIAIFKEMRDVPLLFLGCLSLPAGAGELQGRTKPKSRLSKVWGGQRAGGFP